MEKGKFQKRPVRRRRRRTRRPTALLSVMLILSLAVGGTLAYIIASTAQVDNKFDPSYVTSRVNVNDDGTVSVTNTGDVKAYIRAAIAVNWMDSAGNVRGIAPASGDYTLTINPTDWEQDEQTGYFYYKEPVEARGNTQPLITAFGLAQGVTAPSGYELTIEVVAEAIQADGDRDSNGKPAYQDAWYTSSESRS